MHWWIVEDALKDQGGHYYEYIRTFRHGLDEIGDTARIFVDHTAEDWLVVKLNAEPELPRSIWARMSDNAPRLKKLLRYPIHGWQTYYALTRLFQKARSQHPDIVFFPSVFTHHLVGLVPFLREATLKGPTKFLLFFPSAPICQDLTTGHVISKPDATAKWFPALLAALRPCVQTGQVILGAETRAMQQALSELCALPFTYLPHPVSFPSVSASSQSTDRLIIGHYGTSRHEKGSDLFQAAAKLWLQRNPRSNVCFVLQWTDDFFDGAGRLISIDPELVDHPNFQYITSYFDPDGGYLRQVAATSIMVLPYRDSYRYRLSRVVIEAMLAGLPVVVSQGTTLYDQAKEHGVVVAAQMESIDSLVYAIDEAVNNYELLRSQAKEKAMETAHHFSVATFRANLLTTASQ